MYNISMLYALSRFYFFKKGIYKHIKLRWSKYVLNIQCYIQITPKHYSLKQQIIVILHNFWNSKIWKQLCCVVLCQGLPWCCSKVVGPDCNHTKPQLGMGDPLLSNGYWQSLVPHTRAAHYMIGSLSQKE